MQLSFALNMTWLLFCTALAFLMQAGFCCMESGLSRSKNSIDVAIKNVVDFCVGGALYWTFGFALMFGATKWGLFGTSQFAFAENSETHWLTVFFLSQMVFCGIAITVASGAVAERMRFNAYLLMTIVIGALVYPLFGHWVWAGLQGGQRNGWLGQLGFIDFAGATVVHSIGAWSALAAVILIGPRVGRFDKRNEQNNLSGHNLPMAALGLFILWFGWFGFNGGRAFVLSSIVPVILINTLLAGVFGGLAAMALQRTLKGRVAVEAVMRGVLAGLVAISASCDVVDGRSAVFIGIAAAGVAQLASDLMERVWKIDDVVGAISTHGFAGAWGTIAVALYAPAGALTPGFARWQQLGVQLVGVGVAFAWAFGVTAIALRLASTVMRLRVSPEDEEIGLNVVEYGARTEWRSLLESMDRHQTGDLSQPAPVEPFTEAAVVARQYNRVLKAREDAEQELIRHAHDLEQSHGQIRAQAAQLREAHARAEQASQSKSAFLANMSHEIRTPMTAILGFCDVLLDGDATCESTDERREVLTTIKRNGQHLLNLINDVLDLSKVESGRMGVERIACSLRRVVADVELLFKARAVEKGLKFTVVCDATIPAAIHSDPTRLRQILINLTANAIKFTDSGEVRVEAAFQAADEPTRGILEIRVIDTGIGIPKTSVKELFEPFVQADMSTTRQFGGTGLGLSISRHFARLMGGDVTVESRVGQGSTFTFTARVDAGNEQDIPAEQRAASAAFGVRSLPAAPLAGLTILLAEDGPDNQRLIKFLLEKAGAKVEVAATGRQAVDFVLGSDVDADKAGEFDVILMDMQMPELDGYGATRLLRAAGYQGPIVALTANAMASDRTKCLDAGCDDFATKPIDRDRLIATVLANLSDSAPRSAAVGREVGTRGATE